MPHATTTEGLPDFFSQVSSVRISKNINSPVRQDICQTLSERLHNCHHHCRVHPRALRSHVFDPAGSTVPQHGELLGRYEMVGNQHELWQKLLDIRIITNHGHVSDGPTELALRLLVGQGPCGLFGCSGHINQESAAWMLMQSNARLIVIDMQSSLGGCLVGVQEVRPLPNSPRLELHQNAKTVPKTGATFWDTVITEMCRWPSKLVPLYGPLFGSARHPDAIHNPHRRWQTLRLKREPQHEGGLHLANVSRQCFPARNQTKPHVPASPPSSQPLPLRLQFW